MLGLSTYPNIQSFLSNITCGVACWEAKEEICHCSCGGKNHGIHRRGGKAERTAKIDGIKYKLQAVGRHRELMTDAENINSQIIVSKHWDYSYRRLRIGKLTDKDKGAAARLKYASQAQIDKWPELAAFKGESRYFAEPAILWVRDDFDAIKANQIQIHALEIEAGRLMNEFNLGESCFVWKETQKRLIGDADISKNRFWEKPGFYLEILHTVEKFGLEEISRHSNEY